MSDQKEASSFDRGRGAQFSADLVPQLYRYGCASSCTRRASDVDSEISTHMTAGKVTRAGVHGQKSPGRSMRLELRCRCRIDKVEPTRLRGWPDFLHLQKQGKE